MTVAAEKVGTVGHQKGTQKKKEGRTEKLKKVNDFTSYTRVKGGGRL